MFMIFNYKKLNYGVFEYLLTKAQMYKINFKKEVFEYLNFYFD